MCTYVWTSLGIVLIIVLMIELPPLPTVRKRREADVTPKVLKWFREHHQGSAAIEVKATDTDYIPEGALKDHQRAALLAASGQGLVHKIADAKRKNPFDAFMLQGVQSYVVACFTKRGVCLAVPASSWKGCRPSSPHTHLIRI